MAVKRHPNRSVLAIGHSLCRTGSRNYEISRYGTMIAWTKELGLTDAVPLLAKTLKEEKAADEALTRLAEITINQEAEATQRTTATVPATRHLEPERCY